MGANLLISNYVALGNRYLVIDSNQKLFHKHLSLGFGFDGLRKPWLVKICRQENADGILFGPIRTAFYSYPSEYKILLGEPNGLPHEFGVIIFNADGMIAEKSGNGLRIFAYYLRKYYLLGKKIPQIQLKAFTWEKPGFNSEYQDNYCAANSLQLLSETIADLEDEEIVINLGKGKVLDVSAQKTKKISLPDSLKFFVKRPVATGIQRQDNLIFSDLCLEVGVENGVPVALYGGDIHLLDIFCVDLGNPHCVLLFEKKYLTEKDLIAFTKKIGAFFESHPFFPNRTNVQVAYPNSRKSIQVYIWERGSGFTQSSGSSAAAVYAVCLQKGLIDQSIKIEMLGGTLKICANDNGEIKIQGKVEEQYYNQDFFVDINQVFESPHKSP